MNDGCRILEWARQNRHTLTWVAERIGYSRQALSEALHNNRISPRLAAALFAHFSLRIAPTDGSAESDETGQETRDRSARKKVSSGRRGRIPGTGGGPGESKLDPYREEIEHLLANGSTQRFIASRFGTTESNLYNWMKKRGLRRKKTDE
jgi:transcriptional regulator with XRE-family HTH domain